MPFIKNLVCDLDKNSIVASFDVSDDIKEYFNYQSLTVEYSDCVCNIPASVAVVPLVSNLAPIAWILGATLYVDELDSDFYESLSLIKAGYQKMYPMLRFEGSIKATKLVENSNKDGNNEKKAIELFSGGVDGLNTLVRNHDVIERFVTVWGADIPCTNDKSWENAYSGILKQAKAFGLDSSFIKTDMRVFINERKLTRLMSDGGFNGHGWWHDLQHSIALLGLSSIVAYLYGCKIMYIAASYSVDDKKYHQCASDPSIDNLFKCAGISVSHDGYEENRQTRIQNIVDFANLNKMKIPIRACYASHIGVNCCNCEKCGRTILGILAAGGDPSEFGFDYSEKQFDTLMFKLRYYYPMVYDFYRAAPKSVIENHVTLPNSASWLMDSNLQNICENRTKDVLWSIRSKAANVYHKLRG